MEIAKKLESINGLVTLEHEFLDDMRSHVRDYVKKKLGVKTDGDVIVLSSNLNITPTARIYGDRCYEGDFAAMINDLDKYDFTWNFRTAKVGKLSMLCSMSEGDLTFFIRRDDLEDILSESEITDDIIN